MTGGGDEGKRLPATVVVITSAHYLLEIDERIRRMVAAPLAPKDLGAGSPSRAG
jgi:hypothetical protein